MSWISPENDARIIGLLKQRRTYSDIAAILGVSRGSVGSRIYYLRNPNFRKERPSIRPPPRRSWVKVTDRECTAPFAGDSSCSDFAWDDMHCDAVYAARQAGFPAFSFQRATR